MQGEGEGNTAAGRVVVGRGNGQTLVAGGSVLVFGLVHLVRANVMQLSGCGVLVFLYFLPMV